LTKVNKIKAFAQYDFGLIFFFLYAALSLLYYQERTLFLDNSFQVFHMIVEDKIEIMAGRWPASLIRCLPYLGIKAGLPLQLILQLFSFSYLLFHFIVFGVLRWVMDEKSMSNFYALWLLLMSGHAFFWNNSELIQACSVLFVFMALVKKANVGVTRKFALFGLLILLLFYHPLVIVPVCSVLLFWILQNPKRFKEYLSYLLVAVLLHGCKTMLFPNWYDTGKNEAFAAHLVSYGSTIIASEGFLNNVQSFLLGWNSIISILCIAGMYFFFKEKKWLCFIALPLGILFYIVLIAFADPKQTFMFYSEVNFIPLIAIVLLGCMQLSHKILSSRILCTGLLLFFVFRLTYTGSFYTQRIDYWKNEIASAKEKEIRGEEQMDMSQLVMSWASPYESLVLSALDKNTEDKTILVHPDRSKFKDKNSADIFLTHFKPYTLDEVNARYFKLDRTQTYFVK